MLAFRRPNTAKRGSNARRRSRRADYVSSIECRESRARFDAANISGPAAVVQRLFEFWLLEDVLKELNLR